MAYVLFINDVLNDGLGDLGHLIDIANPKKFKQLLQNSQNYEPLYLISCEDKPQTIQFVIDSLKSNGLITQDTETRPTDVREYLKQLLSKNPQLHICLYDAVKIRETAEEKVDSNKEKKTTTLLSSPEKIAREERVRAQVKNEIQQQINDYIKNNKILQEQLNQTHAIEWVSTKQFSLPELDKLPVLQTFLAEHGKIQISNPSNRGMGFADQNYGLLLAPPTCTTLDKKAEELAKLNNKKYLKDLLEITDEAKITLQQAKEFLQTTLFIPGYLQDISANTIFIQSLTMAESMKNYQNIVFHVNGKVFDKTMLNTALLAKQGIGFIEFFQDGKKEILTLPDAKTNTRRLRIFSNYWLDNDDYPRLYKIAQLFAGCSGDKTLEMTLSNYLIPVYEARKWKDKFSESFEFIAKRYTDDDNIVKFIQYYRLLEKRVIDNSTELDESKLSQHIAKTLSTPGFIEKWQNFIAKIHENYNYNDKLSDFINEGIAFHILIKNIKNNQFIAAAELLKSKDNDNISFIFKELLTRKQYDVAAFVYYLHPQKVKNMTSGDKDLIYTLDYFNVKKNNYPDVKEPSTSQLFPKPVISEQTCYNRMLSFFIETIQSAIQAYKFRELETNPDNDMVDKLNALLEKKSSPVEKFKQAQTIMREFKSAQENSFPFYFLEEIQKRTYLTTFFNLPNPMKHEQYQKYFEEIGNQSSKYFPASSPPL